MRAWFYIVLSCLASLAWSDVEHIGDLRLGRALYAYHQQHYFDALTELHIAQQAPSFVEPSAQAQLLDGTISLLFGLEQHAADSLNGLLNRSNYLDETSKNTAWLYLAKLHHHNGNWGLAARRLDKMGDFAKFRDKALAGLQDERYGLMIDIAIRQNNLATAETLLARWNSEPTLDWAFAQFNIASAYAREGRFQQAANHYAALTQLAPVYDIFTDRSFLALYDKALVNRGYALLRSKQAGSAVSSFQRVRLNGDYSAPGLMAWGWAENQQGQPQQALAPWQALADRTPGYAYRQSALLGIAGLYEEMNQLPLAVQAYLRAESSFESALTELARLSRLAQAEPVQNILQLTADSGFGDSWFEQEQTAALLVSPWLLRLEASSEFQSLKRDVESVLAMRSVLQSWQQKMAIWDDVIEVRNQRRQTHQQKIENQQYKTLVQLLQQRKQQFEQQLATKAQSNDFLSFVAEKDQVLVKRLHRAQQTAATLAQASKLRPMQAQQLSRLEGLLTWHGVENFSRSHRQQSKQLAQLDQQLQLFAQSVQQLDALIVAAPDVTPFETRIQRLSQQIFQLEFALSQSQQQLESELRGRLLSELDTLQKKMKRYLLASRLSLARIYDSAFEEGGQ